ncbi:MAG TPA: MerR family transcriptional regulator [Phycisphaerae bacterium]|nr:MerR family transcriptional regulator [Phycisphaerae bacterium]
MAQTGSGEQQDAFFTTRQAAEACGVSCQVVRYYTMLGLLHETKRTASGRRLYAPSVVQQMHIIRQLQSLGYALRDIRDTFLKRSDSTETRPDG